jgi:plasmid stabilization system protein ParE
MAKTNHEDEQLAALAGFTVAFFKSNDELWKLFQKAKKEGWDGSRLLAAARNTDWFKKHSEAQRQAQLLKESDPATYKQRRDQAAADVERIARNLGLTLSSKTQNELRDLAFIQGWSSTQVENYLRSSDEYRKRSEARREYDRLKAENPAEFDRQLSEIRTKVEQLSRQTGLGRSGDLVADTAERAFRNNWSDQQIINWLARKDDSVAGRVGAERGQTTGLVAQGEHLARKLSQDYGIRVDRETLGKMAVNYAIGKWDENYLRDWFTNRAKQTYAGLVKDIDAGLTVRDVATPYFDAMGRILEVNPQNLDLFDPTIRRALTGRDADGKPAAQELWRFEETLRKDPRWNRTNNARESLMGSGYGVLQDMGLVF